MEIELDLGDDLLLGDLAPPRSSGSPGAPGTVRSPGWQGSSLGSLGSLGASGSLGALGSPGGMPEEPAAFGGSGAYPGGGAYDSAFEVEADDAADLDGSPAGGALGRDFPGGPAKGRDLAHAEDVFVLDIEDEEEPASLVKPPPDMLQEPRRPSWAQEGTAATGTRPGGPATVARPLASPPQPPLSGINVLGLPSHPPAATAGAQAAGAPLDDEESLGDLPELPELPRLTGEFAFINPFTLLTAPAPPGGLERDFTLGSPAPDAGQPAGGDAGLPPQAEPWSAAAGAAEAPLLHIDSELLERTAAEILPQAIERYEDLVSEAEVLAKYGLEEKAIERLRDAIRIKPRQLSAYFLLIQLQLDKGRYGRVMELANQVAQLTAESADRDTWPKLRRRLLAAGFRVDGERVVAVPGGVSPAALPESPPVSAAAAPEAHDRRSPRAGGGIDQMLQGLIERPAKGVRGERRLSPPSPGVPLAPPSPTAAAVPTVPAVPLAPAAPTASPAKVAPTSPTALDRVPAVSAPSPPSPGRAASPSAATLSPAGEVQETAAAMASHTPAAAPAGTAPGASAPSAAPSEDDFYELPPLLAAGADEATPAEASRLIFNPLEIGAMVESEEIDWDDDDAPLPAFGTGRPPLPASQPPPPAPGAGSPAGGFFSTAGAAERAIAPAAREPDPALDDTGMSWLDEADSGKDDNAARAASLFDEEEDFFDLAGELEQELSQEAAFQGADLLVQQEQSLEEIVEGFKKGVAEHLSPTDYDTHYNLGIAYREMGLLDEAIGEFQLSAKDSRYLVSCCSMLGLCFLDKGLPELAIKWYRRGLEAEEIAEDDTLGLLYDMGCAYLAMGDDAGAYKTFVDVYGIKTNYRDVVARIEDLGHPH